MNDEVMANRCRLLGGILVLSLMLILLSGGCARHSRPVIIFFEKEGCPDCHHMKELLESLLTEYPGVSAAWYDVDDTEDKVVLNKLLVRHFPVGFRWKYPAIFVGETAIVGEGRVQELKLREAVEACASGNCPSPLDFVR